MANYGIKKISGWYYDFQRDPEKSRMTTVSLHSNYEPKAPAASEGGGEKSSGGGAASSGGSASGGGQGSTTDKQAREWGPVSDTGKKVDSDGYAIEPLCTSILTDDFNIGATNNWSDFGNDPASEIWSQIKPLAPYAHRVGQVLYDLKQQNQGITQDNDGNALGMGSRFIMDAINWLADNGKVQKDGRSVVTDYLNRSLVVQGTRFSYYNGTDINFGTLTMKFTVLPTWEGGQFVSVNKQIENLYPYIIGEFVKEQNFGEFAKEFIGWQTPPGGYTPNVLNVDSIQLGTLKLKIGAYYSITNLLAQDIQLNFSKQMVKCPSTGGLYSADEGTGTNISPLYCDITLTLRPATKFSDTALRQFVCGVHSKEEITKVNSQLTEDLLDAELDQVIDYTARKIEVEADKIKSAVTGG